MKKELENMYQPGSGVRFFEPVENSRMPDILKDADILVLPSLTRPDWKEQFGRVLVEAMSCGVVPVGSDSGEIPNVIGDAGFVFPENSEEKLFETLDNLALNPQLRKKLSQKSVIRIKNNFTWPIVAKKIVEVYNNI
jgi:glycosyltransferase involved in cell wall biosynthesis